MKYLLAVIALLIFPMFASAQVESTPEFKAAAKHAWEQSRYGMAPVEAAFEVEANGKPGSITTNILGQGEVAHVTVTIDSDCIGLFHTHPDKDALGNPLNAQPSPHDIAEAIRIHKIVWVNSRQGLWRVTSDGKVEQVFSKPEWFKK